MDNGLSFLIILSGKLGVAIASIYLLSKLVSLYHTGRGDADIKGVKGTKATSRNVG